MVSAIATALQAEGDLILVLDRLEQTAPDDIHPEVVEVRDTFKAQAQALQAAAGNPLGAIASALVSSLQGQPAYDRLNEYLAVNCGLGTVAATSTTLVSGQQLPGSSAGTSVDAHTITCGEFNHLPLDQKKAIIIQLLTEHGKNTSSFNVMFQITQIQNGCPGDALVADGT